MALMLAISGSLAMAQVGININDASFESGPSLIPYSTTISDQWMETYDHGNAAGEFQPPGGAFTDPVPDGSSCLWVNNNYCAYQGLSASLSAGNYTFTVWIGERQDLGSVGWAPSLGQFDLLVANGPDFVNATAVTYATFTGGSIAAGQWGQFTKTYTIASNDPLIGRQLVVRLLNPQIGNYESNFDKPVLTFQAVPEPATAGMLLLGGAGLFALRRRR